MTGYAESTACRVNLQGFRDIVADITEARPTDTFIARIRPP